MSNASPSSQRKGFANITAKKSKPTQTELKKALTPKKQVSMCTRDRAAQRLSPPYREAKTKPPLPKFNGIKDKIKRTPFTHESALLLNDWHSMKMRTTIPKHEKASASKSVNKLAAKLSLRLMIETKRETKELEKLEHEYRILCEQFKSKETLKSRKLKNLKYQIKELKETITHMTERLDNMHYLNKGFEEISKEARGFL